MQVSNDRSTEKPATPDERYKLLYQRIKMLGLDIEAIEGGYGDSFDKVRRNCLNCGFRDACAMDLKHDPNNSVWEAYCPNAGALNVLVELTEVRTID